VAIETAMVDRTAERVMLEHYFKVPTSGLNDEEVMMMYDEVASRLPQEAQSNLAAAVEKMRVWHEAEGPTASISPAYKSGGPSSAQATIMAPDPAEGFGATVGAQGNNATRFFVGSGEVQKVYEYQRSYTNPTLLSEITPSVPASSFGETFSVSGNWMAVTGDGGFGSPGKVFLFKKVGGTWTEQAILTGPNGEEFFGLDVVLEGNTLAVVSADLFNFSTTVLVYRLTGNNWQFKQAFSRPGEFYIDLDIDKTGNRIIAGGFTNLDLFAVNASIFALNAGTWSFEQTIFPSDTAAALLSNVAIDQGKAVLGAFEPGDKQYLFTLNGGTWSLAQELITPTGNLMGGSVVGVEGNQIIVGIASTDNSSPEAIYLFKKQGGTFSLTRTFTPNDGGVDVILSDAIIRGNTIVVGSRGDFDVPGASGRGVVFKISN